MHKLYIIIHFYESNWGDDIAMFTVPENVSNLRLMDKMDSARAELHADDFDSKQDLCDAVIARTAELVGGTVEYVHYVNEFTIREDEED